MVKSCRERLTGDVLLKRAESMALNPGKLGSKWARNNVPCGRNGCGVTVTPVTILCDVECGNIEVNNI